MLYTVLILKKFKDSFVADARAKKFNVREFVYNPEAAGSGLSKLHKMEHELQESLVRLLPPHNRIRRFAPMAQYARLREKA